MMINDLHEIEELLGAYALDAVDPDERARVEAHLVDCASCRAEVDEHLEVVAVLSGSPAKPSGSVWEAIAARTAEAPIPATVVPMPRRSASRTWSATWVSSIAAAVAVILAIGFIAQANRIGDLDAQVSAQTEQIATLTAALDTDPLVRAATAALDVPGATVANLTGEDAAGAMLIVVLPDGTGYVYESTLQDLPDDLTYQLWAVVDGKIISAGVLGNHLDVVPFHLDPHGLQGLVITREVAGGVSHSEADPVVSWFEA